MWSCRSALKSSSLSALPHTKDNCPRPGKSSVDTEEVYVGWACNSGGLWGGGIKPTLQSSELQRSLILPS